MNAHQIDQQTLLKDEKDPLTHTPVHLLSLEKVGKHYGNIIAAVIGGCLLTGGYGSAVGGAIGAFIFGMANKGIVYAQWNPDWFKFFLGLMLLLATIVNLIVKRRADASK